MYYNFWVMSIKKSHSNAEKAKNGETWNFDIFFRWTIINKSVKLFPNELVFFMKCPKADLLNG